jgi:MinD superfamily P-loop ATPase
MEISRKYRVRPHTYIKEENVKQILITSGKGGTGKTIITASFASLAERKVLCDCDVDAADLHLLLHPVKRESYPFSGGMLASIEDERCTGCGECIRVCRFEAIEKDFTVDAISCEGCGLCARICPEHAITMRKHTCGEWYISDTKYGTMVHAKLGIAEENSGKLVSVTREAAKRCAEEEGVQYVLIDGPPGIGCPVIASLSGVDLALMVTEPTLSGIHDLERIHRVAKHFGILTACVINKGDINYENTRIIKKWCEQQSVRIVGVIPFERKVTEAIVKGIPPVEDNGNSATEEIKKVWKSVEEYVMS